MTESTEIKSHTTSWPRATSGRLAEGAVSDVLLAFLTFNLLAILMAGSYAIPLGFASMANPSLTVSAGAWTGLVLFRFGWRRWKSDSPRRIATWIVNQRFHFAVAALTLVGLVLRVWGIDNGLPLILPPDEHSVAGIAVDMLLRGSFDPSWYIYPTFFMNLLLPAYGIYYIYGRGEGIWESLADVTNMDPGFYLVGRMHAAVLGALTIVLTYWLAVRLWPDQRGRRAGLVAATAVTFSFIHVRESHFAITDVPMTAVLTAALVAIAGILVRGETRDYVVAGLLCGLAGSTKYTALPVVASLVVAHVAARPVAEWPSRRFLYGLAALPAGFVLGSPYAVLNWPPFLEHMGWLNTYSGGATPEGARQTFLRILGYSAESGFGLIFAVTLLVALVAAVARRGGKELMLAALIFATLPQLTQTTHPFFPRFLVPLLPAAAVLVGVLCAGVVDRLQRRGLKPVAGAAILGAVTAGLVWSPALESVQWDRTMRRPDTRTTAYEWLVEEFPAGAVVASEVALTGRTDPFVMLHWAPLQRYGRPELEAERVDLLIFSAAVDRNYSPDSPDTDARRRQQMGMRLLRRFIPGPGGRGPGLAVYQVVE